MFREDLIKEAKMAFWLMKSEPSVYSLDDLKKTGTTPWEGVRNYQARNIMRDDMAIGDLVLFYHSNAKPTGAVGVGRVSAEAYPDHFAWKKGSKYFDARSTPEKPVWMMVDVDYVCHFPEIASLADMKEDPALDGMMVIRRGSRLSVQPVEKKHFQHVCRMGGLPGIPKA
jgi:predicted RNA-binding protein with PUA-like domain|tara:strand:- start:67 stop:576 length:510 start_codon:yes stop_codon:yes gene_type:complete